MRNPGDILLISCYELGHEPLGLASAAAFLDRAGFVPLCLDLSVERLDRERTARAALVGISVPMHTALRIGVEAARKVRALNPRAAIVYYGLYAGLNANYLLADGEADAVIAGEAEGPLVLLAEALTGAAPGMPLAKLAPIPGVAVRGRPAPPHLARLDFPPALRSGLKGAAHYAHLERNGEVVAAGYVEASRGCLHLCRHCPIPPVYGGRFFVVPAPVVLADIAAQVDSGVGHITFGDPDFLNGPGHVMAIVRELHRRHPEVTFDVTVKVEHVLKHRTLLPELRALGCAFVVSAVEALDDRILDYLDKGHTRADVVTALELMRAAELPLRPTFVAFMPWTTAAIYLDLFDFVESRALIDHVDPVQYALRLLLPPGSLLLAEEELKPYLSVLDEAALSHRWIHPDPAMDELQLAVGAKVAAASEGGADPMATFYAVRDLARARLGASALPVPTFPAARLRKRPPRLTEDWFC